MLVTTPAQSVMVKQQPMPPPSSLSLVRTTIHSDLCYPHKPCNWSYVSAEFYRWMFKCQSLLHKSITIMLQHLSINDTVPAVLLQGPYNRSSPVGSSVNFSCEATSEPQHTITWIFNNTVISSGGRYDIKNTPTISTLIITDIQEVDAGTYSCTVSNIHGNGTASAELVVQSEFQYTNITTLFLILCCKF